MSDTISADSVFTLNPSFAGNRAKFNFLLDAYNGTGGYEDGSYLDPHTRELIFSASGEVAGVLPKYSARQARAYYPNIVKTIVDVPVQYVYQANIRRDGAPEYRDFVVDCNGRGVSVNSMFAILSRYARLFGAMFFIIDKPENPNPIELQTHADDSKYKPRIIPIFPSDVIDWYIEDGVMKWVKVLQRCESSSDPLAPKEVEYKVTIWTETTWERYTCDTQDERVKSPYTGRPSELLFPTPQTPKGRRANGQAYDHEFGTHDLGVVPFVGLYAGVEPEFGEIYATTDVYHSALINRRIYNLYSELDEILRDQTFSLLTYPAENPEDVQVSAVGTGSGLLYKPTQSGLKPEYISPNGGCASTIVSAIEDLREEMYRGAHLHFAQGVQQVRSGVAKAWNFDETNRFLAALAKCGEHAEQAAGRLVMLWMKPKGYVVKPDDVVVQYPGTFNIADLSESIQETDLIIATGISKTFAEMKAKDLVSKVFPNLSEALRSKIYAEIEESPNLMPPPIDAQASTDAAKGSLRARVAQKRGRQKRLASDNAAPGAVAVGGAAESNQVATTSTNTPTP